MDYDVKQLMEFQVEESQETNIGGDRLIVPNNMNQQFRVNRVTVVNNIN